MLSVCISSSSAPHDDDRGRGDDDDDNGGGKLCHIYAQIRESSTPSNVVVCSGDGETDQRRHHAAVEKLVYTSESHVVRVQLAAAAAADGDDAFFLIKFEGKNRGTDLRMPTACDRSVVAVYTVAPPGGRGEASPPYGWIDVQKLCNMCVLSLSWNFFVSHDKYIARPSSKEPR